MCLSPREQGHHQIFCRSYLSNCRCSGRSSHCFPLSSMILFLINELINQVADSSTNWWALKLLVSHYFRRGAVSTISLTDKDLMGKERRQKKLHITVSV